jgi:DNA-binding NarL/FixJ family response regulator
MKVLVVSDHALIGQSLVTTLHSLPASEPVAAYHCDATTVIGCVQALGPDVVLLEASMDYARALLTARMLIGEVPDARIVVLGREADEAAIYEAVTAGADGYLPADASLGMLASTLRGVVRGELGLSRAAALRVVQQLRRAARPRADSLPLDVEGKLTRREHEVLDLVRRGLRSREIGEQLSIAEATVYKHIQNILDKLQVHSRTQAIVVSAEKAFQELDASRNGQRV